MQNLSSKFGCIAQLVEREPEELCVGGSIPSVSTNFLGSSKGRKAGFELANGGSSPSPRAIICEYVEIGRQIGLKIRCQR